MYQISIRKDIGASKLYQAFQQFEENHKALEGGKRTSCPKHRVGGKEIIGNLQLSKQARYLT